MNLEQLRADFVKYESDVLPANRKPYAQAEGGGCADRSEAETGREESEGRMTLPDLGDGVLPEGVHVCSMDEVERTFGRFQRTDRRQQLTATLRRYVEAAQKVGNAKAVVVDGSYVTAKDEPGDIDVMLVLKTETNLADDLSPTEYNAQSKRMVRRLYGFDLFAAVDGSAQSNDTVDFLSDVKTTEPNPYTNRTRKGIVRIEL